MAWQTIQSQRWIRINQSVAGCRKRQYEEGTNATQVQQSARGKDGINSSLVAGVAGLVKVRLRVHGSLLTLSFLPGLRCPSMRGCPNCGMLINHDDGCKHMICYGSTTMRHQSITAMHDIEDPVRSRRMKAAKKMMKAARKKSKEVATTFLVRG